MIQNCPVQATVIAATDCSLMWIDRRSCDHLVKRAHAGVWARRERFLSSVEVLGTLTTTEKATIAEVIYTRVYREGQRIIRAGEQGDEFFMVEEGSAFASVNKKRVKEYRANDYFGELALLRSQPRAADVIAASTPTRVAILHSSPFKSLLGSLDSIMTDRAKSYARGGYGKLKKAQVGHSGVAPTLGYPSQGDPRNGSPGSMSHALVALHASQELNMIWTCPNQECLFHNLAHMRTCVSCGTARAKHPAQPSGLSPDMEADTLALLPAEQALEASLHSTATNHGAATPRPSATRGLEVIALPGSIMAAVSNREGNYLVRYVRRSAEGGRAQGPFPLAPGESFQVNVKSCGTFGEVGLGLAPLRIDGTEETSDEASTSGAEMVGWAADEVGFHGDHGRWYHMGKLPGRRISPSWQVGDVLECGITLRGHVYFLRNGDRVAEADGVWPIAHAFPTVTLRSAGSELTMCLNSVAEKSGMNTVVGGGTHAAGPRNGVLDLLASFKKSVVADSKRGSGPGITILDRWLSCCSVTPAHAPPG